MKHGLGIAGLALALVAFVSVPPAAAPSNLSFGATAPGGIWSGMGSKLVPFGTRRPSLLSFATPRLPAGNLGSFAVLAESGHFGGGGLVYESPTAPIPEAGSVMLFGVGLVGLAGVIRRRVKK